MHDPLISKTLTTFIKKIICQKLAKSIEQLNISNSYKCSKRDSKKINLTCIGTSCFDTSCFGTSCFCTSSFGTSRSKGVDGICEVSRSSKLKANSKI